MALRTVGVRLTADVSAYMSSLKRAGAATKDFGGQLDKSAKAGNLDAVADRAGVAGIALVGMAGYAIKAAADFDKAMSGVKAATHASAADMEALRKAALQAGKDTSYSATEAAKGITELSKAGVSTADVLGGGLKGALSLAAAGQLDVGEAAETAASAMTQFKLSGKDIPHIADLLAAGAGKAQGSVHDMGMALNQSGLVASQFGLSIEDSTGTLAAFASAGLTGSDAGTSFKQMLLMLANPAEKTQNLMEDLGIAAYDASGKFVGITNLAEQLKTKLSGLTQAQRDAALAQIFGSDAIRSANVLYQQGGKGIQDWINKVNDAGYASKTAGDLTDNLSGDIERLKGSLETMAIEAGGGANGGLRVLVKSLEALVDQFGKMPSGVSGALTVLAGVGGVVALALTAFVKLRSGLATAVEQLNAMGPAGEKAATGLGKAASAAGKAAAAFAILQVAGAVADQFGDASVNVDRLTDSLTNFSNTGKVAGELNKVFGQNLEDLGDNAAAAEAATHGFWKGLNDLTSGIPGVNSLVDTLNEKIYGLSFNQAKENMAGLDQALTNFMNTTNDAKKSSELWNRVASESGIPIEHLIELLPNAYKKVGELNTAADKGTTAMKGQAAATGEAAAAQKEYKTSADAAAGAARGERDAIKSLSDFMKAESDPVFGLIDAQDKLAKAQKNVTDATKEHGKKSAEAKAATRDLAVAAIDLQNRVGGLSSTFDGKLSPSMRNTLKAAGLTKDEIRNVEKQFKDAKKAADSYAGKYKADVSITGDKTVGAKLNRLGAIQQALKEGKKIAVMNAADKKGFGYAEGGWTGPGAKYQEAGVVHADEFVINKDSRRKIESRAPGALDQMNATGRLPGYASGGLVGWPYPVNAADTRVPSRKEVEAVVVPALPKGGRTSDWIVDAVHRAFPGMAVLSKDRPGARTLTGNTSYHARGRAVDFPASKPLAEWINAKYFAATRELITPWQSLNIQNGRRHSYSPIVYNQHNFAGGNAHDHWAMKNGGTISEPIFGVGASGRTYSFGENYQRETVTPHWQGAGGAAGGLTLNLTLAGPVGSQYELESWLSSSIDNLRRKGKV